MRNSSRVLAIVAALALAAIATFGITTYVRGVEERAFQDAELVEVFVTTQELPAGLSVQAASEAGVFERSRVPRATLPPQPVSSLDQLEGLVTAERLLEGEVLSLARWSDPGVSGALLDIPEGFEAVSIQVGIPPGVAGFVQAGDRISILAHVQVPSDTDPDTEDAEAADETRTQYLLQDVQVLSIGQRQIADDEESAAAGGDTGSVLATLALEPADIERLVFAYNEALLHFTLLPEDAEPQNTPGRTFEDLFQ